MPSIQYELFGQPTSDKLGIYLAGPVNEVGWDAAFEWRASFKQTYGAEFEVCNPLERDSSYAAEGITGENLITRIAMDERQDILNSDCLIALLDRQTMGTAMGIMYAFTSGRTVVVVCKEPGLKLSKMVQYHKHYVTDNFEAAVAFLRSRYSRSNIRHVINREGKKVPFDKKRIQRAIQSAINGVYHEISSPIATEPPRSDKLANAVHMQLEDGAENKTLNPDSVTIDIIQDNTEKILMDNADRADVHTLAKAYILYRKTHDEIRTAGDRDEETKQFVGNIIHDLKSPAANIEKYVQRISRALESGNAESVRKYLANIESNQKDMMNKIFEYRSNLERRYTADTLNLKTEIEKVLPRFADENVKFDVQIPDAFHIHAAPDRIRTIFEVLVQNSIIHGFQNKGGVVHIASRRINEGNLILDYWNNGNDMAAVEALAIFDRKERSLMSRNFGIGLPQVRSYMRQIGGSIECVVISRESDPAKNAIKTVELGIPLFRLTMPLTHKTNITQRKVLLADNDPRDLEMAGLILEENAIPFITARSPEEVLKLIQTRGEEIGGAIFDYDFEHRLSGLDLLHHVKLHRPEIRLVLLSSQASQIGAWRAEAEAAGAYRVFDKSDDYEKDLIRCFEGVLK